MHFLIFLVLILILNPSCATTIDTFESNSLYIEGKVSNDIEVSFFDGSLLKPVRISDGRFRLAHDLSSGYYGVVFLTKKGFYPEAFLFKAEEKPAEMKVMPLQKIKDETKGVLTGVLYKSATGGKIKEHNGIVQVFTNEPVTFLKDFFPYTVVTDENGIFKVHLSAGEYSIMMSGREIEKVTIEAGRTSIKNIRRGLRLID
ncbi:MAG: hypothetical protein HY755_09820 [Nitrospirae bacterium]|nr:hypothetical protein [Nitrospirota bacterium]